MRIYWINADSRLPESQNATVDSYVGVTALNFDCDRVTRPFENVTSGCNG
jgi:hypothetical protein